MGQAIEGKGQTVPGRDGTAWWFEAGLRATTAPLFVLDNNQHCLYLNPAAERFSGWKKVEVVGRPLHELLLQSAPATEPISPEQIGFYRALLRNAPASGEATFIDRSGSPYPVEYSVTPIGNGTSCTGTVVEVRDLSESRQAEEALRLSEERFRTLAMAHASVVWIADNDGLMREAELWESFTGQSIEEARGWGWLDCVHPDDRKRVETTWNRAAESKRATELEYRIRHADGGYRYVKDHFAPLLDRSQHVREWIGVLSDVNERRQAEEVRARLAAIVESSDDAIVSKNLDGIIQSWNRGAEKIFGYSAGEVVGRPITVIIPSDRLNEETQILARLRRGERIEHYETVRRRKDGTLLDISLTISPVVNSDGEVIGASKIARDITERKRAEQSLAAHAKTLETINRVSASLSADLQLSRLVQVVSDAGTELSGAELGAFLYAEVSETVPGESYALAITRGEAEIELELPLATSLLDSTIAHDGVVRSDDFPADERFTQYASSQEPGKAIRSFLAAPVVSRTGKVTGSLFFAHRKPAMFDERAEGVVSALASHAAMALDNARLYEQARRLNATLEEKVASRTKQLQDLNLELESFNYSVSHDLRAPLRAIDGFSRALLDDFGEVLDGTARHYLERIRVGVQRMTELTNALLDMSRLTRVEIEPIEFEVGDVVRGVIAELRERGYEGALDVRVEPGLKWVADPSLMRIVVDNLLGNAWKFSRGRDPVCIEVGSKWLDGETVYFVRDNGVGFAPDQSANLFVPFQRLHRRDEFEGTGIGLATVQRIIHRHGGRIWAEGEPDRGATFYFTLPVKR